MRLKLGLSGRWRVTGDVAVQIRGEDGHPMCVHCVDSVVPLHHLQCSGVHNCQFAVRASIELPSSKSTPTKQSDTVVLTDEQLSVVLEVWVSMCEASTFLRLVASLRVDLGEWLRSGGHTRLYPVDLAAGNPRQFLSNKALRDLSLPYIHAKVVDTGAALKSHVPSAVNDCEQVHSQQMSSVTETTQRCKTKCFPKHTEFSFEFPSVPISKCRSFRKIRVAEIIHERQFDVLADLIPAVPYATTDDQKSCPLPLLKALVLLQFSCQYTRHCVEILDQYSRDLVARREHHANLLKQLEHRKIRLAHRTANLQHESHMLTSSLDGMKRLLDQLDPSTLEKLQTELHW